MPWSGESLVVQPWHDVCASPFTDLKPCGRSEFLKRGLHWILERALLRVPWNG